MFLHKIALKYNLRVWHWVEEPLGHSLKGQQDFRSVGDPQGWGKQRFYSGGWTQGLTCTGILQRAVPQQEPRLHIPRGLRSTMTHHEGNDTGGGSPRETDLNELSWGSTFWHQDLATPNNLQARAESLRPNNNQDRTQPITENRMLKVILNSQPPKNTPHDMALLTTRDKSHLYPPVGKYQSLPPRSLHKPLDQPHPPGSRHQNKRN